MAQTLPNGLVIPGSLGPRKISARDEKLLDKFFPQHIGHTKWPMALTSLVAPYWCMTCQTTLRMTLAAALVATIDDPVIAAASTEPLEVEADSKYPHECPRCHGPAYVGLNDVDCKYGCK